MKKYILSFLISFFLVQSAFAVSYGGGSTYSIPNVQNSTWQTLLYNQDTSYGYYPYLNAYGSGAGAQYMQLTLGFKINSSSTLSGIIQDIWFCESSDYSCTDTVQTRISYNSTDKYFYLQFDDDEVYAWTPAYSQRIDFPDLPSCPGASTDCIVVFNLQYWVTSWTIYSVARQVYLYSDDDNLVSTYVFTDDIHIQDNFTMWGPAQLINNTSVSSSWGVQTFNYYQSIYSPYLSDDYIATYYLSGLTNPTWYDFTQTFWEYLGSSGTFLEENPIPPFTGSWITEWWYDDCTSFLDLGCYIMNTFNWFFDFTEEVLSFISNIWNIFIEFLSSIMSVSWDAVQMDTVEGTGSCTPQLFSVLNTNNTWWLFDKISSSIVGGVSQIMSVWNAPEDEEYYCLFWEAVYIDYGIYRWDEWLFWLDYLLLLASIVAISYAMSKLIIRNEQ